MTNKIKTLLITISTILIISLILNVVLLVQKNKKDEIPYKITYNGISTYTDAIYVNISFQNLKDYQIYLNKEDFAANYNGIRITAKKITASINDLQPIKQGATHHVSIAFEVNDPKLLEEFYYCGEYIFTI